MGIAASSSPPPEAAAPTDPPTKEETQSDDAAATAPGGDAEAEAVVVTDGASEEGETVVLDATAEAGEKGEEEEGECGFCLFMKGGGCKEEFVGWEKCVEEAEAAGGDVVERCFEATAALRRCMDAHAEYYEPILRAERAMAEDLEAAKAREASEPSLTSPPAAAVGEVGDNNKQPEASEPSLTSPPAAAAGEVGDNNKQAEEVVLKEKEDLAV